MCNFCNVSTGCSCGTATSTSGCNCGGFQRICRDCCGNIRVRRSNCGCSSWQGSCGSTGSGCGCNSGCGTSNSENGGFTCLTFCGNAGSTANAISGYGDWYYARQYGLLPYSGCPCSVGYNYNYDTGSTTT